MEDDRISSGQNTSGSPLKIWLGEILEIVLIQPSNFPSLPTTVSHKQQSVVTTDTRVESREPFDLSWFYQILSVLFSYSRFDFNSERTWHQRTFDDLERNHNTELPRCSVPHPRTRSIPSRRYQPSHPMVFPLSEQHDQSLQSSIQWSAAHILRMSTSLFNHRSPSDRNRLYISMPSSVTFSLVDCWSLSVQRAFLLSAKQRSGDEDRTEQSISSEELEERNQELDQPFDPYQCVLHPVRDHCRNLKPAYPDAHRNQQSQPAEWLSIRSDRDSLVANFHRRT